MPSLWMIGAALAFAAMGACVKLSADHEVPLGQIVFFRCAASLALIYAYLRWRGLRLRTPHWPAHLARSAAGLSAMITYFGAISLIPLAPAVTLHYTMPLFLGAALVLTRREPARAATGLALVAGFLGVMLLLRPAFAGEQWFGALLALASAVFSAGAALNMRRLGRLNEPSWRTVFYFTLFSTLATLPWFVTTLPAPRDWHSLALLAGIGLFATAGQVMVTFAYQSGNTLVTANLGYGQVVFASLLGLAIWGDVLSPLSWAAIAIIVVSGMLATTALRA